MALDRKRLYGKRDRLRQLRAFCYAARLGSITRGAEELGLTQPAVSLHVRELQQELQAVLFERSGQRVSLTPAGERLYELAMPLVRAMDEMPAAWARDVDELRSGVLRIAAATAAAIFVLPPHLKRFQDEYPGIRLDVWHGLTEAALRRLAAGEADLAVGPRETGVKDVRYHPVFSYRLVLVAAPSHPLAGRVSVSVEEAATWPAILPPPGTYSRQRGESVAHRFAERAEGAIQVAGWGAIQEYVAAGLGVAVVPSLCVPDGAPVAVVPFAEEVPVHSYGVWTRRGKPLPPAAEQLIRLLDPEFEPEAEGAGAPGAAP